MRAVGYHTSLPADHPESLVDLVLPEPSPGPRDLCVRVAAISVNPVDTKVRRNRPPKPDEPEILGWDAVGVVHAVGSAVSGFAVGDRVWYAGAINRRGANAELHLVDERIVARAPASLPDAQAAALPLTAITAWELLFERLGVPRGPLPKPATLLITAAAGGVGSVLIQLAKKLTGLHVVGTASRAESRDWVRARGADAVLDHTRPLAPQLAELGLPPVRYAASLSHTPQHFPSLVECLAPQGKLCVIDDFKAGEIDVMTMKSKSLSLHWELMFTRSLYETDDMAAQGALLAEVAALVDAGALTTTLGEMLGPIDAAHLRKAHAFIESGRAIGKLVLVGFP
jgi:zinc-binding alcohol dehydrogenase family protein